MASDNNDLQFLKGVGERRAELFNRLGIKDVYALCRYYPRDYKDWSNPLSIAAATVGEICCIKAKIASPVTENRYRKNMVLYKTMAQDGSAAVLYITIFNSKYSAAALKVGEEFLFYGKIGGNLLRKEISAPEIRKPGAVQIQPIYHSTEGLSSKVIESIVPNALRAISFNDCIPRAVRNELNLMELDDALWQIHFPKNIQALKNARRRLIFEELFILQVGMKQLKLRDRGQTGCTVEQDYSTEFTDALPFKLTAAQSRVIIECIADMKSERPMNRLVQGDVGSGKTAVAAALAHTIIKNGYQAVMMAPTEILAEQHYRSLSSLLCCSGISIGLLTGASTKKEKGIIKSALASGDIQLIVGTHALIEDNVVFKNLGLVITDEQHRFGVAQRARLSSKGNNPHTLVMSATPIPRTLALIVYGDLDISVIDELPPGRQPIDTFAVGTKLRQRAYNYVRRHLDEGRQGYVVCPLIEDNESDLVPALEYSEKLAENDFKGYSLELLHGKMKPAQKDEIMRRFADGEIQLLVSTTVIEVGVDVPNAVIMVIENAERFGLSQLHQLRGRIGRGQYKSTCILISDAQNDEAKKRLKTMCDTCDGFKIADEDLKLRGPGDFFGKRQHGLPDLKIADMAENMDILRIAGGQAEKLLAGDPGLSAPEHKSLKYEVARLFQNNDEQAMN